MKAYKMKVMLTVTECISFAISIVYRFFCILERFIEIQLYPGERTDGQTQGSDYLPSSFRVVMKVALYIVTFTTWNLGNAYRGSVALKSFFGKPSYESGGVYHHVLVASPQAYNVGQEQANLTSATRSTGSFHGRRSSPPPGAIQQRMKRVKFAHEVEEV